MPGQFRTCQFFIGNLNVSGRLHTVFWSGWSKSIVFLVLYVFGDYFTSVFTLLDACRIAPAWVSVRAGPFSTEKHIWFVEVLTSFCSFSWFPCLSVPGPEIFVSATSFRTPWVCICQVCVQKGWRAAELKVWRIGGLKGWRTERLERWGAEGLNSWTVE